ncbi:probable glutamate receptor isoform X2 [Diachasmimorpha longicaudata]|uniref:probable glutamate receptor isoform X2 n=1 Tax=Diachasmimorpha longicaudata TaxID=58733 RepID=UPI0030B8C5D8
MRFLVSFILWTIIIALLILLSHGTKNYGPLIKNIHAKYGNSGVIVVSSTSYLSFEKTTIWHETYRTLSNEGISTLIIDFSQFEERLKVYIERTHRPFVVIHIDTMEALYSFEVIAHNLQMGYPHWLIIFDSDADPRVCETCRNLHGNIFNLNFDSKVLISCCKSTMIEEWWSIDMKRVKTQEIARFNNENFEIEWFTDEVLSQRRHSMDGQILRIAAVVEAKTKKPNDDNLYGVPGEMLKSLSAAMNFTASKIIWEVQHGTSRAEISTPTGILGTIYRDEADLAISGIVMVQTLNRFIRFTTPVLTGYYQFHFKDLEAAQLSWNAYLKVFTAGVWMVIVGLIITTPIALTLMDLLWNGKKDHFFPLLFKYYLRVWGMFCQQSLQDFPTETHLRIFYTSLMMSTLIISSAYSASLMSTFAMSSSYAPFRSMEDFVNDGGYKFIVVKNSSFYDAFKLCDEEVAFFTHEFSKRSEVTLPCKMTSVYVGNIQTLAMITPKNSPYIEHFNYHIRKIIGNGMMRQWVIKHYVTHPSRNISYQAIQLQGIVPLICILAVGILLAAIIFMFEKNWYLFAKKLSITNKRGTTIKRTSPLIERVQSIIKIE